MHTVFAGKSLTAPLDRVKLLLQTRGGLGKTAVAKAARGRGMLDALVAIGREEGLRGYWKGNLPQARHSCFSWGWGLYCPAAKFVSWGAVGQKRACLPVTLHGFSLM